MVIFSTVHVEQSPLYTTVSDSQCSSCTRQPVWPCPSPVCAQPTRLPFKSTLYSFPLPSPLNRYWFGAGDMQTLHGAATFAMIRTGFRSLSNT